MIRIINENKILFLVVGFGFILRISFILVGAELYFSRENIYVDGDTSAWAQMIENFIKFGTYKLNFDHEYSYFGRMPGYSFFIGLFYLICGKSWDIAFPVIGWFQLFMDLVSIWLVWKISLKVFDRVRTANIAAFLYAAYPFIIIWNPVVYSESVSVFFGLLSLFFFVHSEKRLNYLLAGIFLGAAILFRPQFAMLVPALLIFLLVKFIRLPKRMVLSGMLLCFGLLIVYAPWPLRNYINYNKIILTQDLRAFPNWDVDAMAFMSYIYSVKSEWEPQFSDIIKNKEVTFPPNAYTSAEDSILLEKVVFLSKNCGRGFSNWGGYWKEKNIHDHCNEEIARIFSELKDKQIKAHPLNYWLIIPLQNLKKAVFKLRLLYVTSKTSKIIASVLFLYRTIMILTGLFGCVILIRSKNKKWIIFILFFLFLYLSLCFGTGAQFRNIEIRYFLQADILLLVPSALFWEYLLQRLRILKA